MALERTHAWAAHHIATHCSFQCGGVTKESHMDGGIGKGGYRSSSHGGKKKEVALANPFVDSPAVYPTVITNRSAATIIGIVMRRISITVTNPLIEATTRCAACRDHPRRSKNRSTPSFII